MTTEYFHYDRTLRELLQSIPKRFIEILTGKRVTKILDPTFPSVKERRADFLGVLEDGQLVHIEIQAQRDIGLPERMIEILLLARAKYQEEPYQIVLWVGDGKPPYEEEYRFGGLTYRMTVVDVKDIDCEELLRSKDISDNLIAVLCKRGEGFWERLSERVREMSSKKRESFLRKLLYLIKLRRDLSEEYERLRKGVTDMPIVIDLKKDPAYLKGIKKGIKKGIERGKLLEAQESVIENVEERFGFVPEEVKEKIRKIEVVERLKKLRRLALKVSSIDEFIRELN